MAELTAATPGTSGGDRPVGHWGWENFFVLESVAATFVATRPTICPCASNRGLSLFGESHSTELGVRPKGRPSKEVSKVDLRITYPEVPTDPQRILTALFK